jgi:hypothetical protein
MLELSCSTLGCRLWNFTEILPPAASLFRFLRKASGCLSGVSAVSPCLGGLSSSSLLLWRLCPFLFSLPRESRIWELMKVLSSGLSFCYVLGVRHAEPQGGWGESVFAAKELLFLVWWGEGGGCR